MVNASRQITLHYITRGSPYPMIGLLPKLAWQATYAVTQQTMIGPLTLAVGKSLIRSGVSNSYKSIKN